MAVEADTEGEYSLRAAVGMAAIEEKVGDTETDNAEPRHLIQARRDALKLLLAGTKIGCAPPDVVMHAQSKYRAGIEECDSILSEAK